MKKKYIKPEIKTHKLASNSELMYGSDFEPRHHRHHHGDGPKDDDWVDKPEPDPFNYHF